MMNPTFINFWFNTIILFLQNFIKFWKCFVCYLDQLFMIFFIQQLLITVSHMLLNSCKS